MSRDSYDVYVITNNTNGWQYIGVTSLGWQVRLRHHRAYLENEHHSNKALQKDWLECGPAAFDARLAHRASTADEAGALELDMIAAARSSDQPLYNGLHQGRWVPSIPPEEPAIINGATW